MGARVYDPYTGTFTQPDPIAGADANSYGYANGDPVNETDLSGDVGHSARGCMADPAGCGPPLSIGDAIQLATLFVPGLGEEEATADITEGIYEVVEGDGTYVGQSGNIDARLAQHVASGKITQESADNAVRTEVLGGKTAREVAEQGRINELTDGYGASDPRVTNIRNPIGAARQHLMPTR
jgi:hypothetical protein